MTRKGAYWEDRYHATAVETDSHLIQCMVYLDMNMVRAGVVQHPSEWPFSGYHDGDKVQVKANRPSGKPGSAVWNAGPKVDSAGWDILIYILYDKDYVVQEVYQFDRDSYDRLFSGKKSLRLEDMRKGVKL